MEKKKGGGAQEIVAVKEVLPLPHFHPSVHPFKSPIPLLSLPTQPSTVSPRRSPNNVSATMLQAMRTFLFCEQHITLNRLRCREL